MPRPPRIAWTVGVVLAVLLAWSASARAADAAVARLGVVVGPRVNAGGLGSHYRFGYVLGVEAAWQPIDLGRVRLGLSWGLSRDRCYSSGTAANVEASLNLWQMGLGLHASYRLALLVPVDVIAGLRVDLVRAGSPVPPDQQTSYLGPSGQLGAQLDLGKTYLGLMVGYGLWTGGPSGVSILLAVGLAGR